MVIVPVRKIWFVHESGSSRGSKWLCTRQRRSTLPRAGRVVSQSQLQMCTRHDDNLSYLYWHPGRCHLCYCNTHRRCHEAAERLLMHGTAPWTLPAPNSRNVMERGWDGVGFDTTAHVLHVSSWRQDTFASSDNQTLQNRKHLYCCRSL